MKKHIKDYPDEITPAEMMEHYRKLLKIQDGVIENRGQYVIQNQNCQTCGQFFVMLEARQCGNGFFSWRCQDCWKKEEEQGLE